MFNKKIVEQLKDDVGAEILGQLMQVFADESAQLVDSIMSATELNDETVRLSHSLKSCAKSYGATELSELAQQLEALAMNKNNQFFIERDLLQDIHSKTMSHLPES